MFGHCSTESFELPRRPPLGLNMLIQTGKVPGRNEQYTISKHGKSLCAASDEDGDGEIDRWSYRTAEGKPLDLLDVKREHGENQFCIQGACVVFADYDENGVAEITALASGDVALFEMWDDDQDGVFESWRCNKEDGSKWIEVRDANRDGVADYWFHRYGTSGGLIAEDSDHDGSVDSIPKLVEYREVD